MSLPSPSTAGGYANMDPRTLQAMDAPLIALANQSGGDLRKLMFAFFSFLHRRTDFYLVPDEEALQKGEEVKMGFREGDAEKLLLAAFRQFPLRRIPKKGVNVSKKNSTKRDPSSTASTKSAESAPATTPGERTSPTKKNESDNELAKDATSLSLSDPSECVRLTQDGLQIPVGNGGSTKAYKWTQTLEECSVMVGLPEGIRGKDLSVTIRPSHVSVRSKTPLQQHGATEPHIFIEGSLTEKVNPSESTWSIEGGVLVLLLYKHTKTFWKTVIQGDEEIDTTLVDSKRHIGSYDESTQAQIRKIIFDQNQARKGLPSSSSLSSSSNTPNENKGPIAVPSLPPGVQYVDQKTLDASTAASTQKD